ncbi:histidine--tRNA ligase [[Candida] zeylanoides]
MLKHFARNIRMSTESAASVSAPAAAAAAVPRPKKSKKPKAEQFLLKTPKGTKDWADKDMVVREAVFGSLTSVFKKHGGVTIDTPVFELREILTGKYGEDSKLIYNLEDQGGELTSLRYDLTVPFARFVASHGVSNIKRYHIAKVYRRDQPAMTKGRMREFYQCDFDVAGVYDAMVPDSEILSVLVEGMQGLGIHDFKIKLNHRQILDGIFEACGVAPADVRKVSSAVDKLDKASWAAVRREMVEEKAQPAAVADRIGEFVGISGSVREVVARLAANEALAANASAQAGIADMRLLADYVEALQIEPYLRFDLSLARGLDYYTGLIYECVTEASAPPKDAEIRKQQSADAEDASEYVGVGSIAAGGRYDGLVGMFSSGKSIPCVGVSFGIERIFSLIKSRAAKQLEALSASETECYVMAFGGGEGWTGYLAERMAVARQLWRAGVKTEFLYKAKANIRKQFDAADKSGAQVAVILGKEEYAQGQVRIKTLGQGDDSDQGELVAVADAVAAVQAKLRHHDGVDEVTRLIRGLH